MRPPEAIVVRLKAPGPQIADDMALWRPPVRLKMRCLGLIALAGF
jgi:hypothetical protein